MENQLQKPIWIPQDKYENEELEILDRRGGQVQRRLKTVRLFNGTTWEPSPLLYGLLS